MRKIEDKLVSVEKARELQSNWVKNQAKAIQEELHFEDARDFLFSLEELQEYIDLVRAKSSEQGIKNPGIRIYFAAYGETEGKTSTIFLAPTMEIDPDLKEEQKKKVENNYNIQPLNTITGGFPPFNY